MLPLLVPTTIAQADSINGFRSNICVGFASHCPYAQFGLVYHTKRFAS